MNGLIMKPYDKSCISEISDFFRVDKAEFINDDIANLLRYRLNNSPYTTGELASRLKISLEELESILKGHKILTVYDMVHVAGALGFKFKFDLIKDEE